MSQGRNLMTSEIVVSNCTKQSIQQGGSMRTGLKQWRDVPRQTPPGSCSVWGPDRSAL